MSAVIVTLHLVVLALYGLTTAFALAPFVFGRAAPRVLTIALSAGVLRFVSWLYTARCFTCAISSWLCTPLMSAVAMAALAVALIGTFQRRLPVSVRVGLWVLAGMSALSCMYMARVSL